MVNAAVLPGGSRDGERGSNMGLLTEFYAGSPADIGRALAASDHEALRDGSLAHGHADLSLHFS